MQCSLFRANAGQNLRLSSAEGVVLLELAVLTATFLRALSVPSLDCSGSIQCSGSALVGGPLYVGGTDIVAAIAGNAVGAASNLSLTSVTASGDISARDLVARRELHVDGAAVLNSSLTVAGTNVLSAIAAKQGAITSTTVLSASSLTTSGYSTMNGLRIAAGQGYNGTGANLRVVGTGGAR